LASCIRPKNRQWTSDSGQATVELALVLPILLLVTIAVCQLAIVLNSYLVVTSASRDAARRAAETNDTSSAKKAALESMSGLPGPRPEVEVSFPEGRSKGSPVKVIVSYCPPLLLPGLDRLIPRPRFKAQATMALERGGD
jgi:hypothetical protein